MTLRPQHRFFAHKQTRLASMRPSPDEATEQDLVSVGVLRLRREHRLAVARNERLVLDGRFWKRPLSSRPAPAPFFLTVRQCPLDGSWMNQPLESLLDQIP